MKKLKLIHGLILLALCVAVLGIGIYATAPASNTITGTISVTAANAEVEVSVYQDSYNPASPATNRQSTATTRTGSSVLSMGAIAFDASSANTKYEVPLKEIIIVIKNHSTTQQLGAYFWKTTADGGDANLDVFESGDEQGCVQVSDILYGHQLYNSISEGIYVADTNVFDVEYEFYKHIPVAQDTNSDSSIDETDYTARAEVIRMYIRLNKLVESPAKMNLNVHLNIEKYVSNYSNSKTGFVKVGVNNLSSGSMPIDYSESLTHVTLPFGTLTIGGDDGASYFHSSLLAVGMPKSSSIGYYSFAGCSSLVSIFISGINDEGALSSCSSLKSIVIPGSVNSVPYSSFSGCTNLEWVTIPNSVTSIGDYAFVGCTSLTWIKIPSSVTSIGPGDQIYTFWNCNNLASVVFENTTGWQCSDDNGHLQSLSSSDLSNPATAATHLRTTYVSYRWTRVNN